LLDAAAAGSDPESATTRERAMLPPQWVDCADQAKENIKEIREQLGQLAKAQQRRLLRGVEGDAPDQEVDALAATINAQIRVCEQCIHQVRTSGRGRDAQSSPLDDEFRQNTQRSLAAQLQQLAKQSRESQKEYMREVKKRRQQRLAADLEAGAGGAASSSAEGRASQQQVLTAQQLQELEQMEEFAANRSQEVAQIASSIEELNRIFRELAVIVIDQGSILDRIDYNTENVYKKSEQGRNQMEKAVKTKRKNDDRAKWCFIGWVAADAIALVVLLIKWQLKYGLKNVFYFLCFCAVIGVGLKLSWKHLSPICCPRLTACIENFDPQKWWKKIRPGPVNAAKAAAHSIPGSGAVGNAVGRVGGAVGRVGGAVGGAVGGGLNAVRHVWRPPGR